MTSRISDYDAAITEPSLRELIGIARWLQENRQKTFLVGGWAVYFLTMSGSRTPGVYREGKYRESRYRDAAGFQPLGSKDIDLVFQNKSAREVFEQGYCRPNGFIRPKLLLSRNTWQKSFGSGEVELDFALLSETRTARRVKIGWSDLSRHNAVVNVAPGVSVLVPSRELLLLYKCFALVERSDKRGQPNQDLRYLDSKIWKDANDILALHDAGVDGSMLDSLAKEAGLGKILADAKGILRARFDGFGFTQYSSSVDFLKSGL